MIYDDFQDLVDEISESLKTVKKKKQKSYMDDSTKDDKVGGEIPLDKVLAPSKGHEVGLRVPNTSAHNQPFDGVWIEDLESRLIRIIEDIKPQFNGVDDQPTGKKPAVGITGVLGHTKGLRKPATKAAAYRQEMDPYAKRGKAKKDAEEAEKSPEDQIKDALKDLEGGQEETKAGET